MSEQMTALGGEPLPVEFSHGDTWYAGVLLGWRHEPDGTCRVRVQFVIGGLRRSSWMALADVRLPEPEHLAWAEQRQISRRPGPRPDLLLAAPDRSRPLLATPPLPRPRTHGDDLTRV